MKRLISLIAIAFALLVFARSAFAQSAEIRDIDITVTLSDDGSAHICEMWDMTSTRGTEMYLVRDNLGDIVISGLTVSDADGVPFDNVGEWDVDMSFDAKAGKCGVVSKRGGCEICWGLSFYGDHLFRVEYEMTNVVKAYDDYDALHVQFVSPGVNPYPQNVTVTLRKSGTTFDESNSAIWAFGYNGTDTFEDGAIVASTTEPFSSDEYSVILLARFDKGIFSPVSIAEGPFQDKLENAMYGSSYEEYQKKQRNAAIMGILITIFCMAVAVFVIWGSIYAVHQRNLNMFGVKRVKDIGWERDIPFAGNLYESQYVLKKSGQSQFDNTLASAMILRMVYNNYLVVTPVGNSRVDIAFNDTADLSKMDSCERELYDMMKMAAGSDGILQKREFPRWSKANAARVSDWFDKVNGKGRGDLSADGFTMAKSFTDEGKSNARKVIGFKQYLKDFTLVNERHSSEAVLWREYLVFAALYGIADVVAKELHEIDPQAFETYVGYTPFVMNRVIFLSNNMASNITGAVISHQSAGSVAGRGGFSSFGGGGGFSGGGFGGGVR